MYRLSVFKCLLSRAFLLCSTWNFFYDEINCMRSILLRNAYPSWLLDSIIKNSVSHFINPNVKLGPQKDRLYIGMPFLGNLLTVCVGQLKKFVRNSFLIKM